MKKRTIVKGAHAPYEEERMKKMAASRKAASKRPELATAPALLTSTKHLAAAPIPHQGVTAAASGAERRDAGPGQDAWVLSGLSFPDCGAALPRIATQLLGLIWRFHCTLFMLGVLLFLVGTAMVWASRQSQPLPAPLLNIEAIAGYTLKGHISIAVHTTTMPQRRPSRRQPSSAAKNTAAITGTSTIATRTISPACMLDTTSFFCNETVHGWYYNGDRCQSTAQDEYKVCPRITHQHEDQLECESQWSQCNVTSYCTLHQTSLFACSSEDLSRTWYFFNLTSSSCVQWDFPKGACPNTSEGPGFDTKAACEMECNRANVDEKPECLKPNALMPCPADCMRRPYFYSDVLGSGGQCYRADTAALTEHRCVNRSALFSSEAD